MELINYLNQYFYTRQELLALTKVTEADFARFQAGAVMPKCSYKLNLQLCSDSFFGVHTDEQLIEYYAKGYASWLALLQHVGSADEVFSIFSRRYRQTLSDLQAQGHHADSTKLTSELDSHLQQEWQHFLAGIYGLCTKTGLPEDIAAKELAVLEINQLIACDDLSAEQIIKLTAAVDLLDAASAFFAPHERAKSSRHRLIDEVRRCYQLPPANDVVATV